jgi:hypothetical protein
VELMFTDANHCPGAVCILFRFPQQKIVFHTGDFRWTQSLLRTSQIFRALVRTICNIFQEVTWHIYLGKHEHDHEHETINRLFRYNLL